MTRMRKSAVMRSDECLDAYDFICEVSPSPAVFKTVTATGVVEMNLGDL